MWVGRHNSKLWWPVQWVSPTLKPLSCSSHNSVMTNLTIPPPLCRVWLKTRHVAWWRKFWIWHFENFSHMFSLPHPCARCVYVCIVPLYALCEGLLMFVLTSFVKGVANNWLKILKFWIFGHMFLCHALAHFASGLFHPLWRVQLTS